MDSEYLNEEQTLAVETIDGYVQVAAGAGTGKTNTLAYRFKSLIEDEGLRPENIACITFTRKAAHEMKMRIKDITDEEDQGFITTFHGLCVRILREDGNVIYWPNSFGILDEGESKTIMKKLFSKYGLDYSKNTYEEIMAVIGEIKNRFSEWYVNPMTFKDPKILDEYAEKVCNDKRICKYYKEHQLDIFFDYLREQKKLHHLDYNDVINLVLVIFATHENIRKKWAKKLEYIMVDEFQDVNLKQYNLLLNLDRGTENLFVVGDIDQCIYKWRGAAPELFKNFTKNFEPCEIIHMNKNYRSTQAILDTANTLIENNEDRINRGKLVAVGPKPEGPRPLYYHAEDVKKECEWICKKIKEEVSNGRKYSDIAILSRIAIPSIINPLEKTLNDNGIPYQMIGSTRFYSRKEVKETLAYLKMLEYPDDESFLLTVNTPRREVGDIKIKEVRDYAEEHSVTLFEAFEVLAPAFKGKNCKAMEYLNLIHKFQKKVKSPYKVSDIMHKIFVESGLEKMYQSEGDQDRFNNFSTLKAEATQLEDNIGESINLAQYLSIIQDRMDQGETVEAVEVGRAHQAKGLEWPVVFSFCTTEGILPHHATKDKAGLEEERRIFYVIITRAKEMLYLTESAGGYYNGQNASKKLPSRFLYEIANTIDMETDLPDKSKYGYSRYPDNAENDTTFKPGQIVYHEKYGLGKIIDVEGKRYQVRFNIKRGEDIDTVIRRFTADVLYADVDIDKIIERKKIEEAMRMEPDPNIFVGVPEYPEPDHTGNLLTEEEAERMMDEYLLEYPDPWDKYEDPSLEAFLKGKK